MQITVLEERVKATGGGEGEHLSMKATVTSHCKPHQSVYPVGWVSLLILSQLLSVGTLRPPSPTDSDGFQSEPNHQLQVPAIHGKDPRSVEPDCLTRKKGQVG